MYIDNLRNYCLTKNGVTEAFPFDQSTLVFKVFGKMFALIDVDDFKGINLKCDPERSIELREAYHAITGGYHMNKKHWNTVSFNLDVSDTLIFELIDHSYELVYFSLPKKLRDENPIR